MKFKSVRERLLASSMICGAALVGLATPAMAQDGEVAEVVVTGSRIPQPNLTSASPVTVVGAADIATRGITRTEDLVNQLPQVFAAQGSSYANGATGTATVDLRALGANRTLVLIDGRRLQPGTPAAGATNTAPDLNFIPATLVERVEVVTGGASAVYGADAVAGVVNFIMQKNFEGVRLDAQYSGYQHTNENDRIQDLVTRRQSTALDPSRFALPEKDVWDGGVTDINLVVGVNSPDGRGNVTAYAGYRNVQGVTQDARDYSACTLARSLTDPSGFTCSGSGTTAPARFLNGGGSGGGDFTLNPAAAGGRGLRNYVGSRDQFNFAPYNYYQRPDTRYVLGAFANYKFNDKAELYTQLMFMDDHTAAQIAPSGIFGQNMNINCENNPFLSADMVTAFCAPTIDQLPDDPNFPNTLGVNDDADPITPGRQASVAVLRRNVEGGGRISDLRHTDYRGVVGMRGDLGNGFMYDVFAQYGVVSYQNIYFNDFSLARSARALDVVIDPATGQAACRSATTLAGANVDLACRPYDIFSIAGPSQASIDYLQTPGFQNGEYAQTVVSGSITGDLSQYGVKTPWANDGVGFALGTEYRRERLDLNTDLAYQTGDLAGQGGATLPSQGAYDLYELFGEARIPLIQDQPFFQNLSVEVGYRWSDYSLGFSTDTYKLAGDWSPTSDFRLRGSYNRAVRAPNIVELFSTLNVVLNGSTDPCEGANPTATLAQCARTGVTAAQYGNIAANSAEQYNGQTGGNPNLDPETSDTVSFGVVFTPTFVPGFSLSVDWFNISLKDRIGQIGQDVTLERCLETGDQFFCGLIQRAPGTGSLWLSQNGYIVDTTFNTGKLEVEGIDVEANYRFDFGDFGMTSALDQFGGLSFNFQGSYLDKYAVTTLPGDEPYDCAGYYGGVCTSSGTPASAPMPEWRHKLRTTWRTPWDFELSTTWRYVSSVKSDRFVFADTPPQQWRDDKLTDKNYFDIAGTWAVRENVTFRFGVNNVFDNEPPLVSQSNCPAGPCNGNTYPQTYDALGRYLFVGVRADF
ncbi:TonB-dependent receptor [Phenylobacterium sp. J426]|uniref:TonB-dependent receptor plug domain-containing protein n=1 Tax=Phenylobacterium sp. J426 TaxID=2898439 RepID=UPI002150CC37|nr:TonB-dependent receptor [Phenylobacterium sp. J426]MCR5872988.1 TonB-dependent receptor [Phenylobacterium sp. J426]